MSRPKTILRILSALSLMSLQALAQGSRTPDLTIVTDAEQAKTLGGDKPRSQTIDTKPAETQKVPAGKSSRDALELLRQGNLRFVENKLSAPRRDQKTREELSSSQKPFAIVLSCSDSRVPPEILFDQGLGDVFVVRTAGHVLDPGPIASIEYALEHLGARLIVVLGHESCGAVKAALTTPIGRSAGSVDLDKLVAKIRPYLGSFKPNSNDKILRGPVKANTSGVARELVKKSHIVRDKLQTQDISLVTAIYGLSTGQVEFNMWDLDFSGHTELEAVPAVEDITPNAFKRRRGTAASHGH